MFSEKGSSISGDSDYLLSSPDTVDWHEDPSYRSVHTSHWWSVSLPDIKSTTSLLRRVLISLLPSFIAVRLNSTDTPTSTRNLRPTAYLDGLRGLAAWSVVNAHMLQLLSKTAGVGYGHPGHHHELYKLPILRLIFSGDASVSLFFVISGYALSISPVIAMRQSTRDPGTFVKKLASSILRRPFRLYLPVWGATFLVFVLVRLGYFEYFIAREDDFRVQYQGWIRPSLEWPARKPSFAAQVLELIQADLDLLTCFTSWQRHEWMTGYDSPSWTIPLEFRASLVLYLTHAMCYFLTRRMRLAAACLLIFLGACLKAYDFPLFWFGYIAAEISPLLQGEHLVADQSRIRTASFVLVGLLGLHFSSIPTWGSFDTPGFVWMTRFCPWDIGIISRFWTSLGSFMIILALDHLSFARRLLTCRFVQYLGHISFSFYLMHLWVLQTIGLSLFHYSWTLTGRENEATNFIGFCLAYGVMWMVIIWVSDLFSRFVDEKSTAFGFKLEKALFVE